MNIFSGEKISKSYSERILLNEVSLGIDETDKIGLIGVNGTGKSTLLKIIAGVESSDFGNIIKKNGLSIEYLSQDPYFDVKATVIEQVFKGNSPIMKLLREYENTLTKANDNNDNENTQKNLLSLTQQMDNMKAWNIESDAKTILTKLGVNDFTSLIKNLSGGQRKRIALASSLISQTDLLILDEPTNQLDNDTIDWLEKYLNTRKGALIMVTHDRYFLQRVCNRIVEIKDSNLHCYQANYEKYLTLKAQKEEDDVATERKRTSLYRKELDWMMRGARARSTKQKARIDRFEVLKDSKLEKSNDDIDILVGTTRLGKTIVELEDIEKSYDNIKLISSFSYIFGREDRIGIIGPNGRGKSTLLNIISKRITPDSGKVIIGDTVKIGYFTQDNTEMDPNLKVIEYIREEAEFINTADGQISATKMLERFLFIKEAQYKRIGKLSGGEKRRLYLLKILMSAPNVLLLDEPTNDLDIQTLSILENYIKDFNGVVIAVSHDRYFLDRVANRIFIYDKSENIEQFQGNYTDYYDMKKNEEKQTIIKKVESKEKKEASKNRTLKFTYKEQKEYEKIDELISELEEEVLEINHKVQESSTDFVLLQKNLLMQKEIEIKLNYQIERWVYLSELDEAIKNEKENK